MPKHEIICSIHGFWSRQDIPDGTPVPEPADICPHCQRVAAGVRPPVSPTGVVLDPRLPPDGVETY